MVFNGLFGKVLTSECSSLVSLDAVARKIDRTANIYIYITVAVFYKLLEVAY